MPGSHVYCDKACQGCQAGDVQIDHGQGLVQGVIQKRTLQAMTRIVDEHIDHDIALDQPLVQLDDRRDRG
ncbi:hypothetical protein D3C84_1107370 [compost metagenome]